MEHMAAFAIRRLGILWLTAFCIPMANSATAIDSDYYLAGLGLYQETGRDIYLGGLYLNQNTPRPDNLEELTLSRVMEYRVVARRTSIRSLLGGMLLQSEIATGKAPSNATTHFADAMLSHVKTSLYAGDSLEIALDEKQQTTARLNGQRLARIDSAEVSNYLLSGWVNENGPSSLFRTALLATEINPTLLDTLRATEFSAKRRSEVASWFIEPPTIEEDVPPTAIAVSPYTTPGGAAIATNDPAPAAQPQLSDGFNTDTPAAGTAGVEAGTTLAKTTSPAIASTTLTDPPRAIAANEEEAAIPPIAQEVSPNAPTPSEENIQVAYLSPAAFPAIATATDNSVLSLGVQEYSRRLGVFHGKLVGMVYREIRYPQRAVNRNLQGRLELDITLSERGELIFVAVAESSGHKMLDEAAVRAARKALSANALGAVDPVAIAEFGDREEALLVVPVPVNFKLTQ